MRPSLHVITHPCATDAHPRPQNYTASMLARVGDLKHCSLPDDADDADSNEPPELQLLQDNIPDPSSSSGERGTCAVEGPFPIQHHASHANRTSPMLLINTPGINDPKGEDLELIVKWGEGASEITRTTHVVYIYNAERALPNQYLVPYGTFIEPDQETGRARGLQVRAVCIRNSKTTGKDPAGLYRTLCRWVGAVRAGASVPHRQYRRYRLYRLYRTRLCGWGQSLTLICAAF